METILLQSQPIMTFLGLLFNDSTAVSTGSDFPIIFYGNDYAAFSTGSGFPRSYYDDDFTAILYGSDILKFYFSNFWDGFSI